MLMPKLTLITSTMATMVLDTPATMATVTAIIRTMATGEERRGQQKPFLILSQLLTQTLRLMLTMAIMAMVAGMLLTMATLGPTTMVTTGAKVIRSRLLELETQKTATTALEEQHNEHDSWKKLTAMDTTE